MKKTNEEAGRITANDAAPAVVERSITLIIKTLYKQKCYGLLTLLALGLAALLVVPGKYAASYMFAPQAKTKRSAELVFPPPGSAVPQAVKLVVQGRNIQPWEDVRAEVENEEGQRWYKKLEFKGENKFERDDHHYGLVWEDIGKEFWTQIVIVPPGRNLNQDTYNEAQPVERLGKRVRYTRKLCKPGEKLTPEAWRAEMLAKTEIPSPQK